jgi:hypothetical protein
MNVDSSQQDFQNLLDHAYQAGSNGHRLDQVFNLGDKVIRVLVLPYGDQTSPHVKIDWHPAGQPWNTQEVQHFGQHSLLTPIRTAVNLGWKTYLDSGRWQKDYDERKSRKDREIDRIQKTGRPGYVRFGQLPASGRSRNHRDNLTEPGVSVYRGTLTPGGKKALIHLNNTDALGALFITNRPAYEATGTEVGRGSDNEPCLGPDCKLGGKVHKHILTE